MAAASRAVAVGRAAGGGVREAVDAVLDHRRSTLLTLASAQIVSTGVLALVAHHNGWLYFQGGDQIWHASGAWALGHLQIPPALVGYGWSLVLAPIMLVTGPTFLQALPPIVVLDMIVLGPVALACVYGIAERIGGRLLAAWAGLLWVAVPYLAVPLFVQRYHEKYVDQFLPQALGLTAMADYFSMVIVLVAALFVLRSIDRHSWTDAVVAGLALGLAGGAKPPNYLFAAGAAGAYLVARRWREAAAFGVALAPALLTLLLWKQRGLGTVPLFSLGAVHEAAGGGAVAVQASIDRYVSLDWDAWKQNMSGLREFFYSARLAQWAPLAGAVAVARVRPVATALLAGWLGAFLVVKGFSPLANVEQNTFFRLLMPAWPAYLLLFAAIPLLVPTAIGRLGARVRPADPGPPLGLAPTVAAAVLLGLVPLGLVLAGRPISGPADFVVQSTDTTELLTPVDDAIRVRTEERGASRVITWTAPRDRRATVSYRVYRTDGARPDVSCGEAGATKCLLTMRTLGWTTGHRYVDRSSSPGATYRIGVAASYAGARTGGDVFAISPPAR